MLKDKIKNVRSNFSKGNLTNTRVVAFTSVLAMAVLGFSIFGSIYSNSISNAEVADINMYSYALQSDTLSDKESDNYKEDNYEKIAKEWLTASEIFRHKAKMRAYSTFWCFVSLLALVPSFIILFRKGRRWIIPFVISIVLLSFAFATYRLPQQSSYPNSYLDEVASKFPGIDPVFKRRGNPCEEIYKHKDLENHLEAERERIKNQELQECIENELKTSDFINKAKEVTSVSIYHL